MKSNNVAAPSGPNPKIPRDLRLVLTGLATPASQFANTASPDQELFETEKFQSSKNYNQRSTQFVSCAAFD
jgi:hypothetical protein